MPVVWIDEWASIFHAREIVGVRASMKNSLVTGREQRLTNAMPRVSIDR